MRDTLTHWLLAYEMSGFVLAGLVIACVLAVFLLVSKEQE